MVAFARMLAATAAGSVLMANAFAQNASEVGVSPLLPIENEPPPALIEVADAMHNIFTGQTVTFTVPGAVSHAQ